MEARPRIWTADFILACLSTTSYFAGYYLFLPTLPLYLISLGLGKGEIGLIVGAFAVSAALSRSVIGFLYDRGWSTRLMLFGAAGALAIALALNVVRTLPVFLGLRLLGGSAFAAFTTSTSAYAASIVPAARRGEGMGYFTMSHGLGIAAGPLIGTFLMEAYGFGAVTALAAAMATACALLVTRLSVMPARPVVAGRPQMAFYSKRAFQPALVAFTSSVTWGGVISFLPLFVYERQIGSAGVFFAAYAVVLFLSRALAGRLSDRYGRSIAIYLGLMVATAATLLLAFAGSPTTLLISAVLYGLGTGLCQPAVMALAVDRAPESERGLAVATVTLGFDVGITLGAVVLGATVELGGFTVMFLCAAASTLVGALAYGALRRIERRGSGSAAGVMGNSVGG